MRDYLYIWHDPDEHFIVASGLEFKDFHSSLAIQGGVALIEHQSDTATYDANSGFYITPTGRISELLAEDIYSWGNFIWADYADPVFPLITDVQIAELLFFDHKAKPIQEISIPNLNNQFLGYSHDDGWYLKLYYTSWGHIEKVLTRAVPKTIGPLSMAELQQGKHAWWLRGGKIHQTEKTHDIDRILNHWLHTA